MGLENQKWKEVILYGFIFFTLIGLIIYSQDNDINNLKERGIHTEGTITGYGRKNSILWKYEIGQSQVSLSSRGKSLEGLQVGEKFNAIYDPKDFQNALLIFTDPILPNKRDTVFQYILLHDGIKKDNVTVTFSYNVDGITYTRKQYLPENGEWVNIDKFMVIYSEDSPAIGYLQPR